MASNDFSKDKCRTIGELLQIERLNPQTLEREPEHIHHFQEFSFGIISGSCVFDIDGKEQIVGSGESINIPANVPHLLGAFLASLIILKLGFGEFDYSLSGRIAMSMMLLFTSIGHFAFSKGMILMMPDFIPFKNIFVYFTGFV